MVEAVQPLMQAQVVLVYNQPLNGAVSVTMVLVALIPLVNVWSPVAAVALEEPAQEAAALLMAARVVQV